MIFRWIVCGVAAVFMVSAVAAEKIVEVRGHKVEVLVKEAPKAAYTVVFENGSRQTMDRWGKVITALGPEATVFAYNRPGYGQSEAVSTRRDGLTIVEDLRGLLKQEGLHPPYLLVGHSLGGLYAQLFARAHPGEVAGIVLVDSAYPGVIKRPEEFPWWTRLGMKVFLSKSVRDEIDEIHATGEEALALPWKSDIPMVRLINVPKSATAVPVDFGVTNGGPTLIEAVEKMYPKSKRVVVDSDHQIESANPEAVASAIHDVMAAIHPAVTAQHGEVAR